ncbi:hypothetical protein, partial [Streptomyces sp. NPDC013489]|uniref:hypothetical protein n=1 Tax=Streptomyces sp. NPDC013489 TaxID=3155606 RepID=UPI0033F0B761
YAHLRAEHARVSASVLFPGPHMLRTGLWEAVGREDEGVREEEAAAPETPPASRPGALPRMASESAAPLVDQRIPVLTLGVGLALMGLGIGFLGLRMRRR